MLGQITNNTVILTPYEKTQVSSYTTDADLMLASI